MIPKIADYVDTLHIYRELQEIFEFQGSRKKSFKKLRNQLGPGKVRTNFVKVRVNSGKFFKIQISRISQYKRILPEINDPLILTNKQT